MTNILRRASSAVLAEIRQLTQGEGDVDAANPAAVVLANLQQLTEARRLAVRMDNSPEVRRVEQELLEVSQLVIAYRGLFRAWCEGRDISDVPLTPDEEAYQSAFVDGIAYVDVLVALKARELVAIAASYAENGHPDYLATDFAIAIARGDLDLEPDPDGYGPELVRVAKAYSGITPSGSLVDDLAAAIRLANVEPLEEAE